MVDKSACCHRAQVSSARCNEHHGYDGRNLSPRPQSRRSPRWYDLPWFHHPQTTWSWLWDYDLFHSLLLHLLFRCPEYVQTHRTRQPGCLREGRVLSGHQGERRLVCLLNGSGSRELAKYNRDCPSSRRRPAQNVLPSRQDDGPKDISFQRNQSYCRRCHRLPSFFGISPSISRIPGTSICIR